MLMRVSVMPRKTVLPQSQGSHIFIPIDLRRLPFYVFRSRSSSSKRKTPISDDDDLEAEVLDVPATPRGRKTATAVSNKALQNTPHPIKYRKSSMGSRRDVKDADDR